MLAEQSLRAGSRRAESGLPRAADLRWKGKTQERSEEVFVNKGSGPEAALLLATGNRVAAC